MDSLAFSLQIEADSQDEIAESFDIEEVPSFLLLRVRRRRCKTSHLVGGALTSLRGFDIIHVY
jgi:hypothetical protein